jgi:hypothetical protein
MKTWLRQKRFFIEGKLCSKKLAANLEGHGWGESKI